VRLAVTSNTLPDRLGEGRFAAADFLREIEVALRGLRRPTTRTSRFGSWCWWTASTTARSRAGFRGRGGPLFTPQPLAGGYRKKYLRATSRRISLANAGVALLPADPTATRRAPFALGRPATVRQSRQRPSARLG
jgi:hypothetical protein